jgi:hypothetical protein
MLDCSKCRNISLSLNTFESCEFPGHFASMLINCESAFTTTCTLIEWYPFLFTNWSPCCEGAVIRTCVPSIRQKIFGKLPMSYNFLLFSLMPCAVGNFMNLWERRTNALHTECAALETVDWSTLKVSAIIIWKEPLAKKLSDINTLISGWYCCVAEGWTF